MGLGYVSAHTSSRAMAEVVDLVRIRSYLATFVVRAVR
jgi:hypothetical protein